MRIQRRLFGFLAAIVPVAVAVSYQVGDFTRSPDEHIINELSEPFVVREVRGQINRAVGDLGPLPDVLFEIQGPGSDKKIWRAKTNEDGQFRIRGVPEGSYRFKATLTSFQSVMGSITVSKKANKSAIIVIAMKVGV